MKTTCTITIASALLLAAGCAQQQHSVRTDETPVPSLGGSYSADGSYSSGGGGTYSSRPGGDYSGTVGADGTYTPYANHDSPAPVAPVAPVGYAESANTESDNALVAQVRESLRQDRELAPTVPSLQISANNGAILLNGYVQSQQQKHQIFSKILGMAGVVAVNNQLTVMAGAPNAIGENPRNSPLYPTGRSSDSKPIYKDADGHDASTNNALNSTPSQNPHTPLYQQSNQGDVLNPTSRENGNRQIYQDGTSGTLPNQNTNNVQIQNNTPNQ